MSLRSLIGFSLGAGVKLFFDRLSQLINQWLANCLLHTYDDVMLIKEQISAHYTVAPRPQSFAALMDMYEINYMQLRLLLGDLRKLRGNKVACAAEHLPLSVTVKEQSRHTTTLMITYHFTDSGGQVVDARPDLIVRIYHDALQAEVVTHKCRFTDLRTAYWWQKHDSMLLCRWRMNRFLFKWLRYLRRYDYQL